MVSHYVTWSCITYVQYRGGLMINVGDILSTVGVFNTVGDIMSTVGAILSTVVDTQYLRDIMMYVEGISWVLWGVFSTVGTIFCNLSNMEGYHDTCGGYHEYLGGTQIEDFVPYGTEHPHGTHDIPPRSSWYPSRYLVFPTVFKITPQYSKYPPLYWTPPRYSRYPPHLSWYPPWYWTSPWYSRYPPHASWYPPTVLNTPTVLHTCYTGCLLLAALLICTL